MKKSWNIPKNLFSRIVQNSDVRQPSELEFLTNFPV